MYNWPDISGFFDIRNLFYSDKNFPQPVSNGNIKATLANAGGIADNTVIDVSSGHIELGKDPIDFTLKLSNPVTTVNFAGKAKGRLTLDHLKQFSSFPAGTPEIRNVKHSVSPGKLYRNGL